VSATTLVVKRRSAGSAVRRARGLARRWPALIAAAAVLVVALVALLATHQRPALAVPAPKAVALVRADPTSAQVLAHSHYTRIAVLPQDSRYDQVMVYEGPRLFYTTLVSVRGTVVGDSDLRLSGYSFGSDIAKYPLVLGMLGLVFVLMSGVRPVWRLRNLDVLAVTSIAFAVVLFDGLLPSAMVLVAYPLLFYLALRCAGRALGAPRAAAPSTPIFEALTAGWSLPQQRRILRLVAVVSGLIVAMVGFSSLHVIDVGYAVMEGATAITHGLIPYGHIPDIMHGDTYPFGSYLFYVPLAFLSPVHNVWDDADFTLVSAVLAALLVALRLARWGRNRSAREGDVPAGRRELAGLRAAIAWLTFPPLLVTVSTGTTDVVLGGLLFAAVVLWRWPNASTALLALGGWFKLVPLALLPLGLARLRGKTLVRALATVLAVSAPMLALMLALGGIRGVGLMIDGLRFQETRVSAHNLWTTIGSVPLQQITQAATLALIAGAAVRLRRDPELAGDRARIAALCGAVLLGVQISANYWSFMYTAWVVPMLVLSTLAGNRAPDSPTEIRA
jgi:Glycosyltransferase family 87